MGLRNMFYFIQCHYVAPTRYRIGSQTVEHIIQSGSSICHVIPLFDGTTISYLRVHVDASATMIDQTCHSLTGNTEVRQFVSTREKRNTPPPLSLSRERKIYRKRNT